MANATPPAPPRTGGRISAYCEMDWGLAHRECRPEGYTVEGAVIRRPFVCDCSCHKAVTR